MVFDNLKMVEEKKDFKYFVRIAQADLDGNKPIGNSLLKIKGVGFMLANAVCNVIGIDKQKKSGYLSEDEIRKIDDVIKDLPKFNIPSWMFNRRKDAETGQDYHLTGTNLIFNQENDIKLMKKIRSYRGMRHAFGLPVRGQRTKSNFRKNKGRVSLGVIRKKVPPKEGKSSKEGKE